MDGPVCWKNSEIEPHNATGSRRPTFRTNQFSIDEAEMTLLSFLQKDRRTKADQRGWSKMVRFRAETAVLDARFAARQLVRKPGFTVTAIAMLTLGIGASAAIFGDGAQ